MTALRVSVRLGLDGSTWQTPIGLVEFTDVSAQVSHSDGITITRGRSTERDEVQAGTCSLTLIDPDRRFDPENEDGPYYGFLNPGVPIQVRVSVVAGSSPLVWDVDDLKWGADALVWGSQSYGRFYGFVEEFPQQSVIGDHVALVDIEATDAFGMMAKGRLSSFYEAMVLADEPLAYWPLDEESGTSMRDLSGNNRHGTYNGGTVDLSTSITSEIITPALGLDGEHSGHVNETTQALSLALGCLIDISQTEDLVNGQRLVMADYGSAYAKPYTGKSFQWGIEIVSTSAKTCRLFVRGNPAWPTPGYSLAFSYDQPRYVALRASGVGFPGGSSVNHYVDGLPNSGVSNPTAFDYLAHGFRVGGNKNNNENFRGKIAGLFWSTTSDVSAIRITQYADAALSPGDGTRSSTRIGALLTLAGFPSVDRDLATGYTILGSANPAGRYILDELKRVDQTEQGRFFISRTGEATFHGRYHAQLVEPTPSATFSDTGADSPYAAVEINRPRQFIYNKVTVTTDGEAPVVVKDDASIAAYGEREVSVDVPLLETEQARRSLGDYVLSTSKDPQPRVFGLSVPVHRDLTGIGPDVLDLEQGDRVTFERTPVGEGDPISWDQIVEGYTERFDSNSWTWTPHLSPAEPVTFGVFGVMEFESTFIFGF